jgi:glutathionylspermidine synthase
MTSFATTAEAPSALPWRCGSPLTADRYGYVLRRAIFDCCKWHLQVEDRPVLCPFPLLMDGRTWGGLARLAEALARELLQAEQELVGRPELCSELGLPAGLRRCLRRAARETGAPGVRLMRFDFHWTTDGWRVSEANTDVAGGFIEASGVTALMGHCFPGCRPAGDPAGVLASAIRQRIGKAAKVGLMYLTVYVEDGQVMTYLAHRLQEQGLTAHLFQPRQLRWQRAGGGVACADYTGPLDFLFRFFPAEWLPQLPRSTGWQHLLGSALVCNPLRAVLTQSKRLPLVWDRLVAPLPTWRSLLPQTRAPHGVRPAESGAWVLKPALGHEGYNIGISGVTGEDVWQRIQRSVRRDPRAWVAQRRFTPLALPTPEGPLYPCLGVYVIDGHAAGAYGRVAPRPLIDDRSREIVVLLSSSPAEDSVDAPRGSP